MRLSRRWVLALVMTPALARAEPNNVVVPWTIDTLMARLRAVPKASARFEERKTLAALNTALVSSGRLIYVAPDRLEKQTTSPALSSMAVAGDRLTVQLPGETPRQLMLDDYPELGGLVAGIRATLAGDLATLNRFYLVSLTGDEADWILTLQPVMPRMRELVRSISVHGAASQVDRIETREASGDSSVMAIIADGP